MSALQMLWVVSLIVTIGALPPGLIRAYAYRSGEVDHTPTMRTAAAFALTLGLLGLASLAVCSVLLVL